MLLGIFLFENLKIFQFGKLRQVPQRQAMSGNFLSDFLLIELPFGRLIIAQISTESGTEPVAIAKHCLVGNNQVVIAS